MEKNISILLNVFDENKSDTYQLSEVFRKLNMFDIDVISEKLKQIDGNSKFVLISKKDILLIGSWINDGDIFYSNNSFNLCNYGEDYKRIDDLSEKIEKLISAELNIDYYDIFVKINNKFSKVSLQLKRYEKGQIFRMNKFFKYLKRITKNEKNKKIVDDIMNEINEKKKNIKENEEKYKKYKKSWYEYYYNYYDKYGYSRYYD